jgi:tripartite-type tricarboxylate transporter receptor subunit TctC
MAAAEYPDKPIRAFVTVVPGGATDIIARLISEHMSRTLGQSILIENQGGAGGTIALGAVAKAPADGYTVTFTTPVLSASPYLFKSLPYNPKTAFAPVSQIVTFYNMLLASPNFKAKTMDEFMALAKTTPVSVGGGNIGGLSWILMEKLKTMGNLKLVYVPYKGTGVAITDTIGGSLDTVFSDPASVRGFLPSGKIVALGVSKPTRAKAYPNVPAIAEVVPGYEQQSWVGLLAPAGTPKAIVEKLHAAVMAALADPVIQQRLADGDFGVVGSSPDEFSAYLKKESVTYGNLIGGSGLKPE